jgi:hypothetical protein
MFLERHSKEGAFLLSREESAQSRCRTLTEPGRCEVPNGS